MEKVNGESEAHRETLNEKEPDIVKKINAHIRKEKENQKLEIENKKKREKELSQFYDIILREEEENQEDVGYITVTKKQADSFEEEERTA